MTISTGLPGCPVTRPAARTVTYAITYAVAHTATYTVARPPLTGAATEPTMLRIAHHVVQYAPTEADVSTKFPRPTPGSEYVLTLSCPDSSGLVHAVSGFLVRNSGNILESQQLDDRLQGRFFMRVHFHGSDP